MPLTVRKHKKRKTVKYRNKKKVRRRQNKTPCITSEILKEAWDEKHSVKKNLSDMGLSIDANETVRTGLGRNKQKKRKRMKSIVSKNLEENAKAPRVKKFKLPTPQVNYLTYLIKQHGDNYKEMAKDDKNIYQETWKKIRNRIQVFRKLTQYKNILEKHNAVVRNNQMSVIEAHKL